MKSILRVVYDTLKIFILFTACTILFYYGIVWINQEYENYHRYDEPKGSAVKVSTSNDHEEVSWLHRLWLFLEHGE